MKYSENYFYISSWIRSRSISRFLRQHDDSRLAPNLHFRIYVVEQDPLEFGDRIRHQRRHSICEREHEPISEQSNSNERGDYDGVHQRGLFSEFHDVQRQSGLKRSQT